MRQQKDMYVEDGSWSDRQQQKVLDFLAVLGSTPIISLTVCFIYFCGKTREAHALYFTVNMLVSPFMFSIKLYFMKINFDKKLSYICLLCE